MAGSRLFRSIDRGDSWVERPLPALLQSSYISFISEREGWVASVGSAATQCQVQAIAIWHTADAGSTWEQLTTTGIRDGQCKGELTFADVLHGFFVAWDPNQAPVIYRTSDGGRTWSASRPLPDPPGFTTRAGGFTLQPRGVQAFGSTLLLAVGGQSDGRALSYAFRSQDGGASWGFLTTVGELNIPSAFLTASRWIKIFIGGETQETTDAGATWHPYVSDYSQAAPIVPSLVFGDADVGYATVRGVIQRSLDGGRHWSYIKTPGTE